MENKEEIELLKVLDESQEDVRNGRVSSIGETFNSIRDKLNSNMRLLFEIDFKNYNHNWKIVTRPSFFLLFIV